MKTGDQVRWIGPPVLQMGPKSAPTHSLPVTWNTGWIEYVDAEGGVGVRMARDGMNQACHETAESFAERWEVIPAEASS